MDGEVILHHEYFLLKQYVILLYSPYIVLPIGFYQNFLKVDSVLCSHIATGHYGCMATSFGKDL